jgi:hypothetical protein
MIGETRFTVTHKETGEKFWFDAKWGSVPQGKGWIGVLSLGEELEESKGMNIRDNRFPIDPNDYEFLLWDTVKEQDERKALETELTEYKAARGEARNNKWTCSSYLFMGIMDRLSKKHGIKETT